MKTDALKIYTATDFQRVYFNDSNIINTSERNEL